MAYDHLALLIALAERGALERCLDLTTRDLAEWIGSSQQSASIYLTRLAGEGLVDRTMRRRGSRVRITDKGLSELREMYDKLHLFFGTDRSMVIMGKVESGIGEGAYYLARKGYVDQVKGLLGFSPFPGTLNVVLGAQDAPLIELLRRGPGIRIREFTSGKRTFGRCLCYRCTVNGRPAAVMLPNRTIHKGTLEIIAGEKLRDELGLMDGDMVELRIDYPGGSGSVRCSDGASEAAWL